MNTHQRPRSLTVDHNVQSLSKEKSTTNRISLQPGSASPMNNPSGKSRTKFFGGQHTKQTLPEISNNSPELDISYITPRLIVMTTSRDSLSDISCDSTVELIHSIFNTKHPDSYMIYTLDSSSNDQLCSRKELFNNRIIYLPLFDENQLPRLVILLWFCQKITTYLLESSSNVVVLHCVDERNQLAFGACSLLGYHKVFPRVDQIIEFYQSKRCAHIFLTMSQKRYIQYLCDLSFDVLEGPHFNELILKAINLSPIPLVNRQKTGCRPFIDIYDQDYNKIFSTYQEKSKLKLYSASDSNCIIPINIPFNGDLTIHITHAAIGHSRQTHEGGIRICEFTINPNFSTLSHPALSYLTNELDVIYQDEKNPTFRVKIEITNPEKVILNGDDSFTELVNKTLKQPLALFGDENEFQKTINDYEKQFKRQILDITDVSSSLPSVTHRRRKSKEESTSRNSISPLSPQNTNRNSSGYSFRPQTFSSFVNPRHTSFKQQIETNRQSSQILSSPLIEENQNKDKTNSENLLDFGDDDFNNGSVFQKSILSNIQQYDFNSTINSQTNLLDDDFNSDQSIVQDNSTQIILPEPIVATTILEPEQKSSNKPILQNNSIQIILPEPIAATTILEPEQKSSTSTTQSNTTPTTNTPNNNVNIAATHVPSSPIQPHPVQPNPHTNQPQKSKIDIDQYFDELDVLKKDSKRQSELSVPNTIGAARKASLSKDVDPTVLKVREWTEGKIRNLRALLCSLSNIIWPECEWSGCQMNELVTNEQVKKAYRKAVLYIHPDKLRGDPNEALAKLIFVELNEAWSQFEKESH